MKPPSLEILKNYAERGEYYSDCAQLALDRIAELEAKLASIRAIADAATERDGVDRFKAMKDILGLLN